MEALHLGAAGRDRSDGCGRRNLHCRCVLSAAACLGPSWDGLVCRRIWIHHLVSDAPAGTNRVSY